MGLEKKLGLRIGWKRHSHRKDTGSYINDGVGSYRQLPLEWEGEDLVHAVGRRQ